MGPAPAIADVRRAVREAVRLRNRVLVACSGGADSLALAAATAFEAPKLGVPAGFITVDHGLQDGSAEQAARVAAIGYELGFDPVEVIRVEVGRDGGPEAAARAARYRALGASADALDAVVLLGHTLDDQAETVLLGLGRGSGPRSIAGMRTDDGRYLRPFLGLRRSVTVAACAALGLEPWDDPHNSDSSFQRVRLRTEVLPLLEDVLQGGVVEALGRTAELIRADLEALDVLVPGVDADDLSVAEIVIMPGALRRRMLRAWLAEHGVSALRAEHLVAVDNLVIDWHGQGPVDVPGGQRVTRTSGRLMVSPASSTNGSDHA